ncbi:FAD-binding oxidoreductase [Gordonia sp. ABSL1-1]|uniref:FAD-binding oxidoreductase n=1 Tax=Gordonia sp. ABSL1-1 TaxID=3053923 RepID=UPI002574651E|nr:FAD-binding oxidoreductase [Gordonia sp. ABSL1-1]MDL9937238.1 FAD-binding oxidoreductase [Gordonia sp. ABSL1-1]
MSLDTTAPAHSDLTVRPRASVLATLRDTIAGEVFGPDDAGYDAARIGFSLLGASRPAVITMPANAFDVVEAVRFAIAEDLRVAIMATGHGPGTNSDGALLINTSRLDGVAVNAQQRTARIGAGTTWGPVLAAAAEHGLAPLLGSTTGVGAVGYTLGGGFGWLGRRFGLSADAVRSFELVTAAGDPIHVSATSHPEIFWALRGGGTGSLGVVTEMEIDLFEVSTVYAGNLFYPAEDAPEVLRKFREWAPRQSDELTSSITLMNFPPFDEVPEPMRGRSFVLVRGCWCGDPAAGAAVIDEWRRWKQPAIDMWGEMPFAAVDAVSMDPTDPVPAMVTTESFDDLPDEVVEILTESVYPAPGAPPLLMFGEIRHAGGAIAAAGAEAANGRARGDRFLLEFVAMVGDPHAGLAVESALQVARARLAPYTTGNTYLNFTEGDDRAGRSGQAFSPSAARRLAAVKQNLDPDNRFRHGFELRAPHQNQPEA